MRYKLLPHDELRFVAYGKSLEEAIENSAYALFDAIANTEKLKSEIKIKNDKRKNVCMGKVFIDENYINF